MILKTLDITDRKDKNCLEIGNKVSKPYIRTSFLSGESFQALVQEGEI